MKKIVLGIVIVATMFAATSCKDDDVKSVVSEVVKKIEMYTTNLKTAQDKLVATEGKIGGFQTKAPELNKALVDAGDDQSKKTKAEEAIASFKEELAAEKTELGNVEKTVADLQKSADAIKTEEADAKMKLKTLKDSLVTAKAKHDELLQKINGVEAILNPASPDSKDM